LLHHRDSVVAERLTAGGVDRRVALGAARRGRAALEVV